jgi:uncharacterized membrane protein
MPLKVRAIRLPWQGLLKIGLLILLILAANVFADWIAGLLSFELLPSNEDFVHRMIMTSALIYAVLMAIPFVPGVEIGLALIGMLGPPIVFLVYLSTVAGLLLSFAVGLFFGEDKMQIPISGPRPRAPKILKKCSLPLTGVEVVDTIVTELCVIDITDRGLLLTEMRPGVTLQEIQQLTEPKLRIEGDVKPMEF